MARKSGSNGAKIERLERRVYELEKRDQQFEAMQEANIVEDLKKTCDFNPDKFEYTYQEIANKYKVSIYKIQKIADEQGLLRRRSLRIVD